MKKKLIFLCMAFAGIQLFAQRKQATEEYTKTAVLTIPYSGMSGKLTYGYVVSDEGEVIKDGAYNTT